MTAELLIAIALLCQRPNPMATPEQCQKQYINCVRSRSAPRPGGKGAGRITLPDFNNFIKPEFLADCVVGQ